MDKVRPTLRSIIPYRNSLWPCQYIVHCNSIRSSCLSVYKLLNRSGKASEPCYRPIQNRTTNSQRPTVLIDIYLSDMDTKYNKPAFISNKDIWIGQTSLLLKCMQEVSKQNCYFADDVRWNKQRSVSKQFAVYFAGFPYSHNTGIWICFQVKNTSSLS